MKFSVEPLGQFQSSLTQIIHGRKFVQIKDQSVIKKRCPSLFFFYCPAEWYNHSFVEAYILIRIVYQVSDITYGSLGRLLFFNKKDKNGSNAFLLFNLSICCLIFISIVTTNPFTLNNYVFCCLFISFSCMLSVFRSRPFHSKVD